MGRKGRTQHDSPSASSRPPRKRQHIVTGGREWKQWLMSAAIGGAGPKLGEAAAEALRPTIVQIIRALASYAAGAAAALLAWGAGLWEWLRTWWLAL